MQKIRLFIICIQILTFFFCKEVIAQKLKYNNNFSIACHNCYEPKYASKIEDIFCYAKTIEIDIWDSKIFSGGAAHVLGAHRMNHDWYVKHEPQQNGNLNCCGGTFHNCIESIKSWSDKNPNHDVITVFLDKEENWSDASETRKPIDLDQLLLSIFTRENIFAPSDLLLNKPDLEAAVPDNWYSLDSLKGKFIFVITDANSFINTTGRKPLNEYLELQKNNAICFVAPEISNESEILNPKLISQENANNVVFYNLKYINRGLAEKINSLGFISRVYGSPETIAAYNELIIGKVNFIAMFNYKLR